MTDLSTDAALAAEVRRRLRGMTDPDYCLLVAFTKEERAAILGEREECRHLEAGPLIAPTIGDSLIACDGCKGWVPVVGVLSNLRADVSRLRGERDEEISVPVRLSGQGDRRGAGGDG